MNESRIINVKELAKESDAFRKVVYTSAKTQLTIMSLAPGEDIGMESHDADQLIYAVKGEGQAVVDGTELDFEKGDILCIAAGAPHNVRNIGEKPMKLFTTYAPPQHAPDTIHRTKADAEAVGSLEKTPA